MSDKAVKITVTGPSQTGKSIVLARIQRVLEEEFGAVVVAPQLDAERRLVELDEPQLWERDIIRNTEWHLVEASPKQQERA
jgi:ABC-type phosphonate transport system ATPase subunit